MKKIYTLLLLVFATNLAWAQYEHFLKFGVRGGVNITSQNMAGPLISNDDLRNKQTKTDFNLGFYAEMPVTDEFAVQVGLNYSGKGVLFAEKKLNVFQTRNKVSIYYIELPVNAIYKIDNFFIGGGPYLAHAVGAEAKITDTNGSYFSQIPIGNERGVSQIRPFDVGANIMLGYMVNNGLNFNLNYGLGISNIYLTSDAQARNRMLSINVGYTFGKNRNYWF